MIGIKIDGTFLDVFPETAIEFRLENPIFGDDDRLSPGSFTLPFRLPGGEVSEVNATKFSNTDVISNIEAFKRKEASIFFDRVGYKTGKIRAKISSEEEISANFIFGLSTISDEIKTKKLRDILDEEIVLNAGPLTKKIVFAPDASFASPPPVLINGVLYNEATLDALVAAINANTQEPRVNAVKVAVGVSSGGLAAPYVEISSRDDADNPLAKLSFDVENGNTIFLDNAFGYRYHVHPEIGDHEMSSYYDQYISIPVWCD